VAEKLGLRILELISGKRRVAPGIVGTEIRKSIKPAVALLRNAGRLD